MILGVGIDLVSVLQFEEQLSDRASQFMAATFTEDEIAYCQTANSKRPAQHLAARYAAKEAAVKALEAACAGASVTPHPVFLRDIEVERAPSGRPSIQFRASSASLAMAARVDRVWVSLTHDGDYAAAVVTLERIG